jgi:4-amino-4-deoxy-L-arabinose transferase-like glycosyltransferase
MGSRLRVYAALALVAALPRLAVLLYERGDILAEYTEKSDEFARVFVDSGTFGFIPDVPSAWTQPLYGFFLIPVYGTIGRSWAAVGLVQVAVAVATALLVYELGRRFVSPRAGVLAAALATLNPYLIWHDVHVNREILDGLLAVALTLLVLLAAERRSLALCAAAGAVAGLAILGNSRLAALPLVLAGFVALSGRTRRAVAGGALLLVAAALVVTPWLVRNKTEIGCWALTTDAKALWKANNEQTYDVLAGGGWIDQVRDPPGVPPTPEMAWGIYVNNDELVLVDECEQMRDYQQRVFDFWRDHPGEKAKLAAQATGMLWDPRPTRAEGQPGTGSWLETIRRRLAPLWFLPLFVAAIAGLWLVPRRLAVLAGLLLGYTTLTAIAFAGATRYRVPWDFLLAVLAAPALLALAGRLGSPRRRPS